MATRKRTRSSAVCASREILVSTVNTYMGFDALCIGDITGKTNRIKYNGHAVGSISVQVIVARPHRQNRLEMNSIWSPPDVWHSTTPEPVFVLWEWWSWVRSHGAYIGFSRFLILQFWMIQQCLRRCWRTVLSRNRESMNSGLLSHLRELKY